MRARMLALSLSLAAGCIAAGSVAANAQSSTFGDSAFSSGREGSIGELVAQGYEIKSAIVTSGKYFVFLQKDRSAYACEFTTLARSRCGEIK